MRNEKPPAPADAGIGASGTGLRERGSGNRAGPLLVGGSAPPAPGNGRRAGSDLQQQVAETTSAGAVFGRGVLAQGLGSGGGAAVAVVGQPDQPDEQQVLAAGGRFGRLRHDITPCRQRGRRRQRGKRQEEGRILAPPPRNRPPRPSGSFAPGWFPGSGASLSGPAWRLPGRPARWLVATPLLRYRCGGSVGLAPTSQFSPLARAGHLERRQSSPARFPRARENDTDWPGPRPNRRRRRDGRHGFV